MAQIRITNYTFNASAGTVKFNDYTSINLDGILLITDEMSNKIIYIYPSSRSGGTVSGNVLTLDYNTSAMSNNDKLMIYYDDYYSNLVTNESVTLLRRASKLLENSSAIDGKMRQRITIDAEQLDTSGDTIECAGGVIIGPPTTWNAAGSYQAGAGYGQPVSGTTLTGYTNSGYTTYVNTPAATLVDFFSVYDGTTAFGSFVQPALAGDVVLVFGSGYGAPSYITATDNGSGGTNTYTQIDNITINDGSNTSVTALLAPVINTGILTITINTHPTDIGFVAYLIRGVDDYVESVSDSNSGNNPLVTQLQTTTDICSLFTYWAAEVSGQDVFTSFNLSQITDVNDSKHYHASGHILDLPASGYTPGVNQSSGTIDTGIISVFLRDTITLPIQVYFNSGITYLANQGTPYLTNQLAESWYLMTWEGPVDQRWRVAEDSHLTYQKNIRKKLTFH